MTTRQSPEMVIPLYRIDMSGADTKIAEIKLHSPEGCDVSFSTSFEWPLLDSEQSCAFPGIPYFLEDMRPQGFLGKLFARRYAKETGLPTATSDWSDADIWLALTNLGADQVGNLIAGEDAYHQFLSNMQQCPHRYTDGEIDNAYPQLADQAEAGVATGALVGGEFPKFTALRLIDGRPQHVIVKFSSADGTPMSHRWNDLLVCEHIAGTVVRAELGIEAAHSLIYQAGGRTFLEVVRFDRRGAFGRSPVCSWASLNAGIIGLAGDPWPMGAARLHQEGLLDEAAVTAIEKIWHFGRLIRNTDMHDGNLSFFLGLTLAPVYDMLPMAYAPQQDGTIPDREYLPQRPTASERPSWSAAAEAASEFWRRASCDERVSASFRLICQANGERLAGVMTQA